jgi:hypothetical protein
MNQTSQRPMSETIFTKITEICSFRVGFQRDLVISLARCEALREIEHLAYVSESTFGAQRRRCAPPRK